MMKGTIGVESILGKGSNFFFTVQLGRAGNLPAAKYILPPDIHGLNVLVVDDLADSRMIMSKILQSLGFKVETLPSGVEALKRLSSFRMKQQPVDLIMMDWQMPDLDGIETAKRIRGELRLDLPIIIMTAFAKDLHREDAERAGTNGFLTKPIFQSTLFDAIMDAFGKGGVRSEGSRHDFTTRSTLYSKQLRGIKLLLVEDNLTNQLVATAILEKAEIDVTVVDNGELAVQAVQDKSFDGVLMDIQMPRMNGYEATRLIREIPGCAKLPIIAMTAHAMKGDEEKCLEAGMDGYIAKPINQERLFATLSHLLRGHQRVVETVRNADAVAGAEAADDGGAATAAAPAKDEGPPLDLPGIDVQAALANSGLDRRTFKTILLGFYNDNSSTRREIEQAAADGRTGDLLRLAHSLKGSAGNIGAVGLQTAAARVEEECRKRLDSSVRSPDFDGMVRELLDSLEQVLGSLRSLATEEAGGAAPEPPPEPGEDTGQIFRDMEAAIDRADPEAIIQALHRIRRLTAAGTLPQPELLSTLERQINRYDYDQARSTLQQMQRSEGMR